MSLNITPQMCAREVVELTPLVMRALRAEVGRLADPTLTVPQFRALSHLSRNPGSSLSSVAEHLGIARPTASALVDRLVRRGLIHRDTDPSERRRTRLTLTPEGVKHLQGAKEAVRTRVAEVLAPLSDAERAQILQGLQLLAHAVRSLTEE